MNATPGTMAALGTAPTPPTRDDAATIAVSLVSHTNAGKTTLARTLLGRDIGEVRDAPHVTEFAEVHTMLRSDHGDRLELWDTPGFGDSVRLVRRLRQRGNPIGWFLSEVWDRWRDRPFWATQQALRNVRDEADALLYVVSTAENEESAGYVAPELELLAWTGKPIVVLLNQLGAARSVAEVDADTARWRERLAALAPAARVLPFDAFARCWVQEIALLDAVAAALADPQKRLAMERLADAWRRERQADLDASMAIVAESVLRVAGSSEVVVDAGWGARLKSVGAALGLGRNDDDPTAAAQKRLGERADAELRQGTSALIRLARLEGESVEAIADDVQVDLHRKVDAGWAAIWGGALSGAIVGLKADVVSGGLTLGGGMLAGGVIGALGAAGLAEGVNRVRGTDRSWLAWKPQTLAALVEAQLLRYLAVAHFGRGRGAWSETAAPAHWPRAVHDALEPQRAALDAIWRRVAPPGAGGERDASVDAALRGELAALLGGAMRAVLRELYPDAGRAFAGAKA